MFDECLAVNLALSYKRAEDMYKMLLSHDKRTAK